MSEGEKKEFKEFWRILVGFCLDKPGLTQVSWHEINTGSSEPVASKPYRYGKVKQGIINYHILKNAR